MPPYLDEYDNYIEELFQAQFEISENIITHQLEKGQTREDFIKDELKKRFENINVKKGFIAGRERSSGNQADILILKHNAQTRLLGGNCIANVKDVNLLIEVKSNATGRDLSKFNDDVQIIKNQNPDSEYPLFGIFCYKIALIKKNIFKRFGFSYDVENDLTSYDLAQQNLTQGDYSGLKLTYPNIDFILTIHRSEEESKLIYFQKKVDRLGNIYFVSLRETPISKHMWNIIQGRL